MDDPVPRFWDKYIEKTVSCNVPEGARRWYVKHVEAFIKHHSDHRLAELVASDVSKYLEVIGRKPDLPDWRYRQIVDALVCAARWMVDASPAINIMSGQCP